MLRDSSIITEPSDCHNHICLDPILMIDRIWERLDPGPSHQVNMRFSFPKADRNKEHLPAPSALYKLGGVKLLNLKLKNLHSRQVEHIMTGLNLPQQSIYGCIHLCWLISTGRSLAFLWYKSDWISSEFNSIPRFHSVPGSSLSKRSRWINDKKFAWIEPRVWQARTQPSFPEIPHVRSLCLNSLHM